MAGSTRSEVLSLYRKILRVAKTWVSQNPKDNLIERKYIEKEAATLFRKNKPLAKREDIQERILEGQSRLELALHYRNPYPRPVNLPPLSMVKREGRKEYKLQERKKQNARPIYIRSKDEER